MNGISEIAISSTSLIAVSGSDGIVFVLNENKKTEKSGFKSIYDFGGNRLAISSDGRHVATGSYESQGLALYNSLSGNLIWQQKGIKKIQTIIISPNDKFIYAAIENEHLLKIDIETGNILDKLKPAKKIFFSKYDNFYIIESKKYALHRKNNYLLDIDKKSFASLDICFKPDIVFISEAAHSIRAISLSNRSEIWEFKPDAGSHFLTIQYNKDLDVLLSVLWPFEKGGEKVLCIFEVSTGKIVNRKILENSFTEQFDQDGKRLILGSGNKLFIYHIGNNIYDINREMLQLW